MTPASRMLAPLVAATVVIGCGGGTETETEVEAAADDIAAAFERKHNETICSSYGLHPPITNISGGPWLLPLKSQLRRANPDLIQGQDLGAIARQIGEDCFDD